MAESTQPTALSRIWRWGLIGLGLLVFLLLFFADKTNLTNENPGTVASGTNPTNSGETKATLPPLAPDGRLDRQIARLGTASPEEKIRLLDTIVVSLQARNRLAYAANYAVQLVNLDSSLPNQLRAGILSQQATELPYVANDTSLLRTYAQQSVRLLRQVKTQEPENEDALLHLGLALTRGIAPMEGILTLRSLSEQNPRNWQAQYQLGLFSMQTGQFDKAVNRFRNVLELRPQMPEAKFQLASAEHRLGHKDEARVLLEAVLTDKNASAELKQEANILLNQL